MILEDVACGTLMAMSTYLILPKPKFYEHLGKREGLAREGKMRTNEKRDALEQQLKLF
jgi:hypothetical protein